MATIHRIRIAATGFVGAPGVMTLYATDAPALTPSLTAWLTSFGGYMPTTLTWQVPASGDTLDGTSGDLNGVWAGEAQDPVTGSYSGSYAAPVGLSVAWGTDTFVAGRRLRGRSYLVPMGSNVFQSDGSLATVPLGEITAACVGLVTASAGNMVIWHRPRLGVAGGFSAVVVATVKDTAAVLRSRRD